MVGVLDNGYLPILVANVDHTVDQQDTTINDSQCRFSIDYLQSAREV